MLTATAYASKPGSLGVATTIHIFCWIAQFYGHGVHEGRAPALLDNLLGGKPSLRFCDPGVNFIMLWTALFLAPFFVHFEVLFTLGLFKEVKKDLHNDVGKLTTEFKLKKKEIKKE